MLYSHILKRKAATMKQNGMDHLSLQRYIQNSNDNQTTVAEIKWQLMIRFSRSIISLSLDLVSNIAL